MQKIVLQLYKHLLVVIGIVLPIFVSVASLALEQSYELPMK